jgi:hypothetical protein
MLPWAASRLRDMRARPVGAVSGAHALTVGGLPLLHELPSASRAYSPKSVSWQLCMEPPGVFSTVTGGSAELEQVWWDQNSSAQEFLRASQRRAMSFANFCSWPTAADLRH